ncbi:MAG: tetratricopeptide repeat protein [Waterburya sp.]
MLLKLLSSASLSLITLVISSVYVSAQPQPVFSLAQTNKVELNDLLLAGKQYVEKQNYDKALLTYKKAAALDQNNPEIFSGIGYVQTLRKDYAGATEAYQQAINLSPNNPKLHYALGFSLGSAGENLAAAAAYEQAIELEPDNLQNHLGLAVVLARAEEYDRAIAVYKHILTLAPDNEEAHKTASRILIEQQRYPEAIALLQQAVKQQPYDSALRLKLAVALLNQGEELAGLEALELVKRTAAQNHNIYFQAGNILYQAEKYDLALAEYQWAARLKPDFIPAIEAVGKVYLAQQNYFRAIIEFRRLTEIAPENPMGYHNLGIALKARNKNEEAITALNQALKLYQSNGKQNEVQQVSQLIKEINNRLITQRHNAN